jgi:glutathione S-transferase
VPYVNVAITTPEAMDALKASGALTFGQVPLLQMNGVDLVQSRATARYVAEVCNLCGQNPEEEAALAVVADGVRDMRRSLTGTPFAEVDGRGAEARAEAAAALAKYAPLFERALAARGCTPSSGRFGGAIEFAALSEDGGIMDDTLGSTDTRLSPRSP